MDEKKLDKMDVPSAVIKQIEISELELNSYTEEGSQLVTNILLANNNRENNRKETDKRERDIRLKSVEIESEIANTKFMEISDQWPIILKKNDALEIHEHSELQKKRGLDLIEQKNQMIETLKRDLAESDSRFLDEQAAQSEDLRILQERIENQVKFIRKEYKNHIRCIKSTIDQQREIRTNDANERWMNLYNETILLESKSLDDRLAMIEKKENNIMKQYEMNEENIRNLKSNMNKELDNIQREFELIKMKCIENVEKLNYNYQVLKRREEENACAKAAQRRKINKLQDILSTKRKILRETNAEFKAKVPLLRNEIEKLKQDMKRHEKKAERFAEIQEKTYKELWDFLGKQIAEHVEKIFKIDRVIHESQLGVDWHPPRELKYSGASDLPSYRRKPNGPNAKNSQIHNDRGAPGSYARTRERALFQLVFGATVKNAPFVLDSELIEIARMHGRENLTLTYNVMTACGLNTVESWKCILSHARTMATCAVCCGPVLWHEDESNQPANADSERKPESENELINGLITFDENHRKRIEKTLIANAANDDVTLKKIQSNDCDVTTSLKQKSAQLNINTVVDACHYRSFDRTNTDSDNNSTITFSLSLTDFEQLCSEIDSNPTIKSQYSPSQMGLDHFQMDSEERRYFMDAASPKFDHDDGSTDIDDSVPVRQRQLCDNPEHPLTIKDTDYLRVIKKSIDKSKLKSLDQRSNNNDSEYYLTNTLNVKDISDYWKQFLYVFPENRLKLWDILDKAIKKYYQTLHLRFKKLNEVKKLETVNMELKTILKQFMDSEQDDVRLQNICTPKIKKQQINSSSKINVKPTLFGDDFANIRGTSKHIFKLDRPNKIKINRPFTAPMK